MNLTEMTIVSTTVGRNPLERMKQPSSQQKSLKFSSWMQSQKQQNDLCLFPRQTIQYHGNPSLCPIINAEEAEVEWFCEDLQDLLELIPQKDVLFIIGEKKIEVIQSCPTLCDLMDCNPQGFSIHGIFQARVLE